MQTQGITAKEPCAEKPRPKKVKQDDGKALTPLRSNELVKPYRQEKEEEVLEEEAKPEKLFSGHRRQCHQG